MRRPRASSRRHRLLTPLNKLLAGTGIRHSPFGLSTMDANPQEALHPQASPAERLTKHCAEIYLMPKCSNVGLCAGFSDAASRRLSCARCLPASEKRQGTKSRGRCTEGSSGPMGNWRRRFGRLGVQSGGDRRRRCCRADPDRASGGGARRIGCRRARIMLRPGRWRTADRGLGSLSDRSWHAGGGVAGS